MTFAQEIILLFTRFPEPGKSKTRLIPELGAAGAADLQRAMTLSISKTLRELSTNHRLHTEIHYTGGNKEKMQKWLGDSFIYQKQYEGGLGLRMFKAMRSHLGSYSSIMLTGSDCPAVDTTLLQNGLAALRENDIVLGPAFDGGYYLIGISGNIAEKDLKFLFTDINWGTADVLRQTIEKIQRLQLRYHLLKKLHDIDTPEDLRYFRHCSSA